MPFPASALRHFLFASGVCVLASGPGLAQDMEPRRWTPMPVGTNVLGASYAFTSGEVGFDPVLGIDDATVELHSALVSYTHYFGLLGTTARVDVLLPLQSGNWEGLIDGQPASVDRDGLADPVVRFSAILLGAPAMHAAAFREQQQKERSNTTLGAALAVRLPLGEYQADKLINLGNNRFALEPQLGLVHNEGLWSYELTGSVFVFTENDDFFGGHELEQDPLFALQAHVVRRFESRWWVSGGMAYGWNGASEIDGVAKDDERSNLLYGLSFGLPVGSAQALRLSYVRSDALQNVGTDSHSVALSWSVRF